ncbi:hypothetical protein VII_000749 [Vibrio mimicus MB451]|nr:hypothetical protein VII_000749 [Vibrio mimicus MB451]
MKLTGDWYGVIWARLYGTMAIDKEVPTMRRCGYGCCV